MGVFRFTRSGNAVQLITDSGECYQVAFSLLLSLRGSRAGAGFVPASLLVDKVSVDRFPKSLIYGEPVVPVGVDLTPSNDALSSRAAKSREKAAPVKDVVVDW